MHRYIAALLAALCLPAHAQTGAPPATDTVLEQPDPATAKATREARERLTHFLDTTTTLSARFREVYFGEDRRAVAEKSGRLEVKRPGRFRWDYLQPSPSLLLADGQKLWSFEPDLEQVVVSNIDELARANPAQLLGGDADLESDFEVVGGFRVDDTDWVQVRARDTASDFGRIQFGFVDEVIDKMELVDKLGNITQVFLLDVEVNGPLDDARFVFEPPPGADVYGGQ